MSRLGYLRFATAAGATLALVMGAPAAAEPVGRWWSGWGQGTAEYGFKAPNGDAIYFACDQGSGMGTSVSFSIGGQSAGEGRDREDRDRPG